MTNCMIYLLFIIIDELNNYKYLYAHQLDESLISNDDQRLFYYGLLIDHPCKKKY